ncbi:MAG: hypothetical protein H6741_08380 [Alphaproteobacteria bacterium]|nr:hypothetical protein [Alphaproteobacteria bacterium]
MFALIHRATLRCERCGARDLQDLGEEAWRCCRCGGEQGRGLPAIRRARLREELARLTPEEREASAVLDLREARMLLRVAEGYLVGASWERDARNAADLLADALADLDEARQRLEAAALRLGLERGLGVDKELRVALQGMGRSAEEIAIGTGPFQDRVERLRSEAACTRAEVDRVLEQLAA